MSELEELDIELDERIDDQEFDSVFDYCIKMGYIMESGTHEFGKKLYAITDRGLIKLDSAQPGGSYIKFVLRTLVNEHAKEIQ